MVPWCPKENEVTGNQCKLHLIGIYFAGLSERLNRERNE